MNRRSFLAAGAALALPAAARPAGARTYTRDDEDARSMERPRHALRLFQGKDLAGWVSRNDLKPAAWKVENGYLEVVPGKGDIWTKETFTDFQLHVEFWVPFMPDAQGQARGNSGVYLQSHYEVQVLDSYGIAHPATSDCGGLYTIASPSQNACKKPEHWQTYDIWYRAPRFDAGGKQTEQGVVSVLQNGLIIHNEQKFDARPTTSANGGDLTQPGPIMLQDHGCKVRYRNIWAVRK